MSASHEDIERRAYELWKDRGCPQGSPEVDWEKAEQELSGSRPPDGEAGGMASGVRSSAVSDPALTDRQSGRKP